MGSSAGLTKFDGVRFYPFVSSNGSRPLYQITSLLPDEHGRLYLAYGYGGVSVVEGDKMEHIISNEFVHTVYKLALDADGSLWVAATNGLFRYRNAQLEKWGSDRGYSANRVEYVHVDPYGRVWAASGTTLFLLDAKKGKFNYVRSVKSDPMIVDAPDHRVWLVEGMKMTALPMPVPGERLLPRPTTRHNTYQSVFDRDGNFWTGGCPVAMCRVNASELVDVTEYLIKPERMERLDQPWQLSSLTVHSVFEDRESNLWIGTVNGLDKFKTPVVQMVPNLSGQGFIVSALDLDDELWAASVDLGYKQSLWKVGKAGAVLQPNPLKVASLAQGQGLLLLAGEGGIERRSSSGTTLIPLPPQSTVVRGARIVQRVEEDVRGIKLFLQGEGEFRWHAGKWERIVYGPKNAPAYTYWDSKGRMLEGFRNNILDITDQGETVELGPQHGIGVGVVAFISSSPELLISGTDGLQVWKENRFHTLRLEDGNNSPEISAIAVSKDGTRWLNSTKGLLQIAPSDWQRSIVDPRIKLRGRTLDSLFGYKGGAEVAAREVSIRTNANGDLWLTSVSGIGWISPEKLRQNKIAPVVKLLGITANGATHPFKDNLVLAAGTTQLEFAYTALSYTMPERVEFWYRLHGQDNDWENAGIRREVRYTNLRPGAYQLEVVAENEDGIRSEPVKSLPFTIPPTFVQSAWFSALVLIALVAVLAFAYHFRVRQIMTLAVERTRAQIQERERIARTLHDSFLQSVHLLLLRLRQFERKLRDDGRTREEFHAILADAQHVITEGRDQVHELRVRPDLMLGDVVQKAVDGLRALHPGVEAVVRSKGTAARMTGIVAEEAAAIAVEALRNAFTHAQARTVVVAIEHGSNGLTVLVQDDGRGIAVEVVAAGQVDGHWGLVGMRERAARIGARLDIDSQPGAGTTVRLTVL